MLGMSVTDSFDFNRFDPISPWREMGAYEALWLRKGSTFKTIADLIRKDPGARPSDFVEPSEAEECAWATHKEITKFTKHPYGVRIHGAGEYPKKIRVARHPIELLYYQGTWALTELTSAAVVGTRNPTSEGIQRAKQITRALVENKIVPVSGLAKGIDRVVHETAINNRFPTIAVIGTPLSTAYPKENAFLQSAIAKDHLLISQVPVLAYKNMPINKTRTFFPERNVTMSALTEATIIVEASETSGTLTQARAALEQGKKLLILESCFENPDISWPRKFEESGAIRIRKVDDILSNVLTSHSNR